MTEQTVQIKKPLANASFIKNKNFSPQKYFHSKKDPSFFSNFTLTELKLYKVHLLFYKKNTLIKGLILH